MIARATKTSTLLLLKEQGFNPQLVFDIGVLHGTPELYEIFPESAHILVEPILEHESYMKDICSKLNNATYIIAAASSKSGTTRIQVKKDLTGAAMLHGQEFIDTKNYTDREVQTIALDDLCRDSNLNGPFLLKIDVDGQELDVLEGSIEALKKTECAIIEVTLLGPIYEVMDFMKEQGFGVHDIIEPLYRPKDNFLWQVDMVFVKNDSRFRKDTSWG